MIRFATPLAFLFFVPWALAAFWLLRRTRQLALPFPGVAHLPRRKTWRHALSVLPPYLFLAGLAVLIVGAARPRSELSKSRTTTDALAIEMVMDISGSMNALDLSPKDPHRRNRKTRLDVVKSTFTEFVKQRSDDLIGLIAFGGYATTRCPLTLDHETLFQLLEEVQIPMDSTDRYETMTAIGDGLTMACARLAAVTNVKTRIVILLSDGESNAGLVTPEQALGVARQQGIQVYTIGVGSTGYAPAIVGRNPFGEEVVQNVRVSIDESTLKHIAAETGGIYYSVKSHEALKEAFQAIDTLQKTTLEQTVYLRYREYFRPFVWAGLVFVLLALLLSRRLRGSVI